MKNRNEVLKRKIESYLKKGQLFKNDEHKKLEKPFLTKSRKNFTIANLLFKAQYDATPSITREMAKTSLDDADEFITKIEEVLE